MQTFMPSYMVKHKHLISSKPTNAQTGKPFSSLPGPRLHDLCPNLHLPAPILCKDRTEAMVHQYSCFTLLSFHKKTEKLSQVKFHFPESGKLHVVVSFPRFRSKLRWQEHTHTLNAALWLPSPFIGLFSSDRSTVHTGQISEVAIQPWDPCRTPAPSHSSHEVRSFRFSAEGTQRHARKWQQMLSYQSVMFPKVQHVWLECTLILSTTRQETHLEYQFY